LVQVQDGQVARGKRIEEASRRKRAQQEDDYIMREARRSTHFLSVFTREVIVLDVSWSQKRARKQIETFEWKLKRIVAQFLQKW
jgi:hypothetical protein